MGGEKERERRWGAAVRRHAGAGKGSVGSLKPPRRWVCSVTFRGPSPGDTVGYKRVNLKFTDTRAGFSSQPYFYPPVTLGKSPTLEPQILKGIRVSISQGVDALKHVKRHRIL